MIRVGAILIEGVCIRRIGSIGNLTVIVKDEDGNRNIHMRILDGHIVRSWINKLGLAEKCLS
jgi:hypothetical protein